MPQAVRLVDAGNTLVELRSNLTEPFIRAVAARHAQREDAEEEELGQALGQQQVRRYHLSTVYREAWLSDCYKKDCLN
ncbi:unnamed protein product [Durusdinium trenchii]|uniref:Uncharacterized protein n=1 Tax=Durusdinium trenchii TaxID=1381693 RepID=A0ABP0KFM7_9DINO